MLNETGDIVALEVAGRQVDAWGAVAAVLQIKGSELGDERFRTLFSPDGSQPRARRSARFYDGRNPEEATYQVSAKVLGGGGSADELVQLRVSMRTLGWIEIVLNDAADVVAHTVGYAEKDAGKAAEAVMRRKGYEFA